MSINTLIMSPTCDHQIMSMPITNRQAVRLTSPILLS